MEFKGVGSGLAHVVNKFCTQHGIISPIRKEYALNDRIPLPEWFRILAYLDRRYTGNDLGIQLGLLSEPENMGLIAYLCMYCKNIREVFEIYTRYQKVWYDIVEFDVQETQDHLIFYWDNPTFIDVGIYVKEMHCALIIALTSFHKFYNQLVAPAHFKMEKIELRLPATAEADLYASYFSCPYILNAAQNRIYYSKDALDLEIISPKKDEYLRQVLTLNANEQLQKYTEKISFKELIYRSIVEAIQENRTDVAYIAEKIGMKPRLIQHRLKQYNSNYSEQLAEVRKMLAFKYLTDKTLSIREISSLLGYREQASFQHSFKTWTGKSPRQWRLEKGAA